MSEVEAEVMNDEIRSAMAMYLKDIAKIPTITDEESEELGRMLKTDKREYAMKRLVEGNLKLVIKMAFRFKGNGLGIDDLIAEGNTALMKAVSEFDIDCGKSFPTYAMWWIRVTMSRAIGDSHTVRIPTASALKKRNVERFKEAFIQQYGYEPSIDEIKEGMGLSSVEMKNILNLENTCISMNAKFDDEDGESDEIGDMLYSATVDSILDELVKKEEVNALYKAIKRLDEVERIIIVMRYGLGDNNTATLDEVAVKIGKTKERVRQMQKTAEQKLQKIMLEIL